MTILNDIKKAKPDSQNLDLLTIANWTYLHIFLQSTPYITSQDLLYLLGLELKTKSRPTIIQRLYSKYLSTKRKTDLSILLKEAKCQNN